ncbi:MAG: transcription-repair coupling factor [Bacillota bacterium]
MKLASLLNLLEENKEFVRSRVTGTTLNSMKLGIFGLATGTKIFWWGSLAKTRRDQYLILVPDEISASSAVRNLRTFYSKEEVLYFPGQDFLPYQVYARSREGSSQRIQALTTLVLEKPLFVVTTPEAFCQKLIPKTVFAASLLELGVGMQLNRDLLVQRLVELRYEREDLVESQGQFAVRGSLVDVFPPNLERPLRVDFFDDEIDSLRYFHQDHQRTLEMLQKVVIAPAREMLLPPQNYSSGVDKIKDDWARAVRNLEKLKNPEAIRQLNQGMERIISNLELKTGFDETERLQPYFFAEQESILDYFGFKPVVLLDEPQRLLEKWLHYEQERGEAFVDLLEKGLVLPGQAKLYLETEAIKSLLGECSVQAFSSLPQKSSLLELKETISIQTKTMHPFFGKLGMLKEDLSRWKKEGNSILIFVHGSEQAEQLREMLWDHGLEVLVQTEANGMVSPGQIVISIGDWVQGFHYPDIKLVVITEQEILGHRKISKTKPGSQKGVNIRTFTDLKEGDYVVHNQHGIGKYLGVEKLAVGGVFKDYLQIQYSGADRLYIPTDQIDLIQKYIGAEGQAPRLHKLGGTEWNRVKNKVKAAVEDMAEDLLKLYAARETAVGYAFSSDTPWQREFEALFPYQETPDQLQAIKELKRDMEKPKPMERLLCGDVGYGKTEVALRGAFKAINDGKQVAVLVPTTVLAQQHYNTFAERMAGFPINIGLLSRFRTPKEQAKVLHGLKAGSVDLVIGTHRLLSNDVLFKDLGLVVVDEEQRFGVAHKEKLKILSQRVDVLTLTATPIPRTLHMALSGIRDMSVIETPPEDRYPVQTYVVEKQSELIRDAIRKELGRGGQVYYIHNRIAGIERVSQELSQLVPEARIAMAHGQMRETELEEVMLAFVEGEYDVLVCTTIIENGLDIPNVNTLIVDDADHLGLAQLYQIRGRVGRSNRVAYAYFTFRPDKIISQVAQKRLNAIREFTEFGSGFKIAMRDLEIRGAGNLLGPEQHGQILAVGFDLYCRLLEEAVDKAKGTLTEPVKVELPLAVVELAVNAYLPDEYINRSGFKMEMYRRLAESRDLAEIDEAEEELYDRFGEFPEPVKNLLEIAKIRILGNLLSLKRIYQGRQELIIEAGPEFPLKGDKLLILAQDFPRRLSFSSAGGLTIKAKITNPSDKEILEFLSGLLQKMKSLASLKAG